MDWQVYTYAALPSTQEYVRELAAEGQPEGLVVQSLTQTKGRGRHGRSWESPLGNLYMSVLLRPNCEAEKAGQISFVAAIAVSAAMDHFTDKAHVKTLKWPNDILIDGKKCAGILLESDLGAKGRVESLVLGIGVNILSAPEGAISLKDVAGDIQIAVHPFRDRVLEELGTAYEGWKAEGFAPVREKWLAAAHGIEKPLKVKVPGRETTGIFKTLDKTGRLILKDESGKETAISSGDVYFSG